MAIDEISTRRRGRPSRGHRAQIAVRPTPDLKAIYERQAAEMGIPLSSWCILKLNESLGLPNPSYVEDDLRAAAARQQIDGMEELPIPHAS